MFFVIDIEVFQVSIFNDLKLSKNKQGNLKISYKGNAFILIHLKAVYGIIDDYATKAFIKRVSGTVTIDDVEDDVVRDAKILESTYTKARRVFFGIKTIKNIKSSNKDFTYFVKAVSILDKYDVEYREFIDAQIEGLAFANDGKGTFPTPKQLIGDGSETRVLNYLHSTDTGTKFTPEKITHYDKVTPITENPKFMEYYEKVKSGDATLKEAKFCDDVAMIVRGRKNKLVSDYIESLNE